MADLFCSIKEEKPVLSVAQVIEQVRREPEVSLPEGLVLAPRTPPPDLTRPSARTPRARALTPPAPHAYGVDEIELPHRSAKPESLIRAWVTSGEHRWVISGERLRGSMVTVDMNANNPGEWMLHRHVADHIDAGMLTSYPILPY